MKSSEFLIEMAELLEKGWVPFCAREKHQYCTLNALGEVFKGYREKDGASWEDSQTASRKVEEFIWEAIETKDVIYWNDNNTKEGVMAGIKKAIELAEAEDD